MPHARRSWLWRLRRIGLLLLLGLGTTIAVAWAAEVWVPMRMASGDPFFFEPEEWFVDVPSHWPTAAEWEYTTVGIGRTASTVTFDDGDSRFGSHSWAQVEVRVGFPLRSFRRVEVVIEPADQSDDALHLSRVQTGLPLPAWLGIEPADDRRLPLMPIWPGLVGNTLFYALLWWLGLAARCLVIRDRRFRRGLCPACRYNIKFNNAGGCPECGWRRA